MRVKIEMDIMDFEYLIGKFKLKKEFNRIIDACIGTGTVMDSHEMLKEIRHHFIDNQFMKKIEELFGDCNISLILKDGE